MTLLRDRSEYFTAHTQCFYKTYWNLSNFCLYDCLSIHIHQIMQRAILLSQPWRSPTAGLTSCSGRGVWVRENRQNRQNRAWTSGWTCFPVFQHGSTHPPPQHHFGGGSPLQTLTSPWHQQWEPAGTLECLHAEGWRLDDPASLQDIN